MEAADSTSSKTIMSKPTPSQESGWSIYIDDFLSSHNIEADVAAATTTTTSSSSSSVMLKRKRKRKARDDPLEDTASSSSTTTISDKDASELLDMILWKKHNKGNGAKCMELKMEERAEVGSTGCSELRKRGLCLVPVSSLLHFLG